MRHHSQHLRRLRRHRYCLCCQDRFHRRLARLARAVGCKLNPLSATESPDELLARLEAERAPLPPVVLRVPVAITGGRDHQVTNREMTAFWELFDSVHGTELHHGDARGVDRQVAARASRERPGLKIVAHRADWSEYGKSAGPIRNRAMLTVASILIAFPGATGTDSATREARRQGRQILRVSDALEAQQDRFEKDLL